MKKDDLWTDDYFKRLGASSELDFMRFNAMVAFDNGNLEHGSRMSRREFALLISESGRDVLVPDILMMAASGNKNKKSDDDDDDKSESSNKNKMSKSKKKKKMEGSDDDKSETDMKKMMIEQAGGYRFRLDPTNPEVQAKIAEMTKESERRASLREKTRQAAAKALSRDPLLVN